MADMLLETLWPGTNSEQYVPGGGPLAALKRLRMDLVLGKGARTTDQLCVDERHMKFLEARGFVKQVQERCSKCDHLTGKTTQRWVTTTKGRE